MLPNHRLFWKNVIWVGTSDPSALSFGPPYWLKMPLAPHAGHACAVHPKMWAGSKSILFPDTVTFCVCHMHPSQ